MMPGKKNDKKETKKQKSLKRRRERDRKDKHVQSMFQEMNYEKKLEPIQETEENNEIK